MCRFKSAICLKDRVFVPNYDSHDRMLKELKIPDTEYHAQHTFVRVELSPADGDVTSDPMGWKIRIDQDILPDWFVHQIDEERVKVAITDWCKVHVLRSGHHEVHEGVWIASGSATVRASGSATVRAYDSATVEASGSATVRAYDSATVRASGSATVEAYDSATVRAYDSATVRAYDSATVRAYDSATVEAYDSATVRAYDSATVRASGSATVEAYDSATVIIPKNWGTSKPVQLSNDAICVNYRKKTVKSATKWAMEE